MADRVRFIRKHLNGKLEACYRCKRKAARVAIMEILLHVCLPCIAENEWPEKPIYIKFTDGGSKFTDLRMDEIMRFEPMNSAAKKEIDMQVAKYRLTKL